MSHSKNVYHSAEGQAGYIGSVPQQQHQPVTSGRPTCPYETCVITDPTASRFAVMMLQYFMNIANVNTTTTLDQFDCPVAKCMKQFTEPLEFVKHLINCPELSKGEFECRKCETWHRFPTTERGWLEFSGWEKTVEKKKRSSFTDKLKVMVRSSPKHGSTRSLRSSSDSCVSPSAQSKASSTPSSEFSAGSPFAIVGPKESEVPWRYDADAWPTVMPSPGKPLQVSTGNTGGQAQHHLPVVQLQRPQDFQQPQELCAISRVELWDTGIRSELPDNPPPSTTTASYKAQDSASRYEGQAFWPMGAPSYAYALGSGTWTSLEGQLAQHTAHRNIQHSSTDSHSSGDVSMGLLQTTMAPYFGPNLSESPVGLDVDQSGPVNELPRKEISSSHTGSYDSTGWSFASAPSPGVRVDSLRTNSSSGSSVESFECVGMGDWAPNGDPIFSTFDPQNEGHRAVIRALQDFDGSAPKNQESCHFDLGRRHQWYEMPEMESAPVTSRLAPAAEGTVEAEEDGDLTCGHENCDFRPSGTKLHNYRKYLHKHRETHRRARYECDQCPSAYTRSDNLKKHRREKHNIEETRGYGTVRMSSQYRRSPRIAAAGQDGLGRIDTLRVSKSPRR
ncbi:hypothetical protein MCOR27_005164 [Pyricularia oryzae]|uniref:C2H2-type domain-containing protein n=2 Tax=Pyricularia TaxID=48558 RepID=A0ABQ8NQJ3_PYRGI|nr:hypothetical protein MCOR01_000681 [Pyricularia oryzae]KAI6299736.1 hypothetical protein MCOR33_004438 [Pyricularia grisea]KAH9428559.1 hypothetical protein MCOR02_011107 [Pyricularia oryzae]KAI6279407.1 hypothetical protein MCOR27_005164 [Pyricularia oryzae]KAI6279490.1 hypothetical protein MCOR26_004217 [Pyricularia oryzae]